MSNKPNILILMPDQMRADSMGCAGHPQIRTPAIDALAATGTRFDHCFTPATVCVPARVSFLTGQYPHNHHSWWNQDSFAPSGESVFRRLREAGYHTAHIGKSHYCKVMERHADDEARHLATRGIDYAHEVQGPHSSASGAFMTGLTDRWQKLGLWEGVKADYRKRREVGRQAAWPSSLPVEEYNDSYVGRQAVDYLEGYEGDAPFCIFVGFGGPHEPFDAPGEYATMYDPSETPPAIEPDFSTSPGSDFAAYRMRQGRYTDSPMPNARASYTDYIPGLQSEEIAKVRCNYYGKITLIDHWIGQITDTLEKRGLTDNTVIVFWSDHGEMLGDHSRLAKGEFFDSVQRVPLIVSWPGHLPANLVSRDLVQLTDIFPTLLDVAGIEIPDECQGASLFGKDGATKRNSVLSEIYLHGMVNYCVRTRTHKYAMDGDCRGFMLYDLRSDPGEKHNLCGNPGTEDLEYNMRDRLLGLIASTQYHH